jgi:hypothetical protein
MNDLYFASTIVLPVHRLSPFPGSVRLRFMVGDAAVLTFFL